MLTFTGTHECTLDGKGRIQLPVSLRRQLAGEGPAEFVLRRSIFSKCLELFPKSEWDLELEKINQLNRYNPDNLAFIRLFMAGSKPVEMDATGRILITKDLLNYAGITKDVVVASRVNVLEVWDKEAYENTVGSVTPEAFAELARKVMGNTTGENIG
ncbi:MAG: division/cell wall cluster transcriptional repressor MraZ [Bacteroidales bacterium]|jgi:MraZ protein|nr:division/cell wall cluster transcriptional repressor MraZ [Bacteroidales bacterium]NPV35144.1 division/cell wall cluster transcriptional repressor MraZ [Bacteroidales bacterium]